MKIVSDTSPIIGLAKIKRLDLLNTLAGEILIPRYVHRELFGKHEALFDVEMAHDAIISILIVTVEEWSGGIFTVFPIYQEIMRDGVLAA